jgi:hypothetical protein
MNSPLMQWLNRPQGQTPQAPAMPQATGQQPNGMQIANVLRDKLGLGNSNHPLSQFASPFMDWLGKANFSNRGRTPEGRAAIRARIDAMRANRPQGQAPMQGAPGTPQGVAGLPGQAPQAGQPVGSMGGYDASPPGQAAGNNATASGINSAAQGVATGLGVASGIAGVVGGVPGITGIGHAINALGLNELDVPDMQVNNELSTNNVAQDISGIQDAMANFSVGQDAMNTAANAVADGSSGGSGSASGGVGTGADGSGGNAGDPGGEGNGGTYRKGGYIKPDGDRKLEARKVTAHEGEFVIRPEAVQDIGVELLRRLNARKR